MLNAVGVGQTAILLHSRSHTPIQSHTVSVSIAHTHTLCRRIHPSVHASISAQFRPRTKKEKKATPGVPSKHTCNNLFGVILRNSWSNLRRLRHGAKSRNREASSAKGRRCLCSCVRRISRCQSRSNGSCGLVLQKTTNCVQLMMSTP